MFRMEHALLVNLLVLHVKEKQLLVLLVPTTSLIRVGNVLVIIILTLRLLYMLQKAWYSMT